MSRFKICLQGITLWRIIARRNLAWPVNRQAALLDHQDDQGVVVSDPESISVKRTRGGLLRATGIVSLLTMASRVLGLLRDIVLAQFFGAGLASDAFFVAFKIPNFLRRLFAEGAFAQAFVPVLAEYRATKDQAAVRALIASTTGLLSTVLGFLTLLCVLGSPYLVWVFAPGFHQSPEKMALTAELLRWTFPYLFFIANVALAASVLNAYGHFATPAAAPILLNVVLIGSALLAPGFEEPILVMGWGVLVAGVVQWALQLPALWRRHLLVRPRWDWQHPGVRRIGQLMIPALFGVSVSQINLLLDTVLASFLQSGSVSWLYYADRLMELPLGVFGIAIATVILPRLSQEHAAADQASFAKTMAWGIRLVLVLGVPAGVALCVLAEPILTTLFQYRAFSPEDTLKSALALRAYGLGVVAFMLVKVLAPGFFARQDTKTPVKIAVVAMTVNMLLNLALIFPFAHMGLALATSLSALLNATLLYFGLLRRGIYVHEAGGGWFLCFVLLSASVMGAVLWWAAPDTAVWFEATLLWRVCVLTGLVALGGGAYLASLFLFGVRPKQFTHQ